MEAVPRIILVFHIKIPLVHLLLRRALVPERHAARHGGAGRGVAVVVGCDRCGGHFDCCVFAVGRFGGIDGCVGGRRRADMRVFLLIGALFAMLPLRENYPRVFTTTSCEL